MRVARISTTARPNWAQIFVNNRYVALLCRLVLSVIFLLSSYGKLVNIERYSVDAVYNFGILPMWLARPFGLVMPFAELLCAFGLLFGVLTRLAALGAAAMSLAFFIAKAMVLLQGRNIQCGCFGAIVDTLASTTIFMDLPMMLMGLVVLFSSTRHWLTLGGLLSDTMKRNLQSIW